MRNKYLYVTYHCVLHSKYLFLLDASIFGIFFKEELNNMKITNIKCDT